MDEEFQDVLKILIETLLHPKNLVINKINNHELSATLMMMIRVCQSNELVGTQSLYELTVTELDSKHTFYFISSFFVIISYFNIPTRDGFDIVLC